MKNALIFALFSILLTSCKNPYGKRGLFYVEEMNKITIGDGRLSRIDFQKGDCVGHATLKFSNEKHDFLMDEISYRFIDSEPEYKIDPNIELECKEFFEKYYFLSKEKMLEFFPIDTTKVRLEIYGMRYIFRNYVNDDSYYDFSYSLINNYLKLDSAYCYEGSSKNYSYSHLFVQSAT